MGNTIHAALSTAVMNILKPLARILLRNGISYGNFAELAKKAYVEVAFCDFQEAGRMQSISKVSALTGLTRKETKRLHEADIESDDHAVEQRYNRAVRVISGWLNDKKYLTTEHKPKVLKPTGNGSTFAQLVKEHSGDIPTQAMLSVLKKAGSVIETDQGIQLVNHAYIPGDDPIDKLQILGNDVAELIATINHNLTSSPEDYFYQRKVSTAQINPNSISDFRKLSSRKAQSLLESLDTWLTKNEVVDTTEEGNASGKYVSLGIYYCEQEPPQEK